MAAPDLVNLSALIDDARCFALVRQHRWPEGVRCPACGSGTVVRDGFDDAQVMASQLREGVVERKPGVTLSGEVECDEVYVVAGHKGHPAAVAKKGGPAGDGG